MADNGGPARRGPRGATMKSAKSKKKSKALGKMALTAINRNDRIAEEWLAGGGPRSMVLARVVRQYGENFDVVVAHTGAVQRVVVRGLFKSKGAFRHAGATTAVRVGGDVLVEDGTIMAVLTEEQAARAARRSSSSSRRSSSSSLFDRSEALAALAADHAAMMGQHRKNLANIRRATVKKSRSRSHSHSRSRRSSSGRTAKSSATNASSNVDWSKLNAEKKEEARAAKLSRRKERRRAKRAGTTVKARNWFGLF